MADNKTPFSISRRQFIRKLGLGAGVLTLGRIGSVQSAPVPGAGRKETFDVVVIGTGLAGMAAAVTAHSAGATVAVLEKLAATDAGGNSKIAGGAIAIAREDTPTARDEYVADFMQKSTGKADAAIIRVLADHTFDSARWLQSQGVELTRPVTFPGTRVGLVVMKPGVYRGMPKGLETLRSRLTTGGARIVYATEAKQLITDPKGAVIGVRAKDAEGLTDYLAGTVIIASGGYAGNGGMLASFVDPDADTMMVRGLKTNTGDGLAMAREAGAVWVGMGGMASLHVAAVSPKESVMGNPARALPYLVGINRQGRRYVDESSGYVANGKASMKQPGQITAQVFDETIKQQPAVAATVKQFGHLGIDIVKADTLDELAGKINAPAAALAKTIADFNAAVKDGRALAAHPPKSALAFPIAPPHCMPFTPWCPGSP